MAARGGVGVSISGSLTPYWNHEFTARFLSHRLTDLWLWGKLIYHFLINCLTENPQQRIIISHLPNGLSHPYQLNQSIFHLRGVFKRFFIFIIFQIEIPMSKQCRPWSDAAFYGVWSGSALFAYVPKNGTTGLYGLTTGKSCSFCLPRVPFVNCRQFMYLVISLLVLRAGYRLPAKKDPATPPPP